jgi:hypothetical protein
VQLVGRTRQWLRYDVPGNCTFCGRSPTSSKSSL